MMLIEQTVVPLSALPVQALKDHLRLGTGFADDAMQDAMVEGHLRAGLAAIEGRIGKALIARSFKLVLAHWRDRDGQGQALPLAPISAVTAVVLVDEGGIETPVPPSCWRLVVDRHRPRLAPSGLALPLVPMDGRVEITFQAGFGDWAAVPADLQQAVLRLAGEYYERRHEGGAREAGLPSAVQQLIEPWRNVRVLGGGGR